MSTIFYGIAGEGRGHAGRSRALIEELRRDHRVIAFAQGQAHELLAPLYRNTDVEIRKAPSLEFAYGSNRRVDYVGTWFKNLPYLRRLPNAIHKVCKAIEKESPKLVITDFEPLLSRAAKKMKLPLISLDHQHFLEACDLSALPLEQRVPASLMQPFVSAWCPGRTETIVSSFFEAPLRHDAKSVTQVGILMRPEVRDAESWRGGHVVAYLRNDSASRALSALENCGVRVHVYGLGANESRGSIRFCKIDPVRFVHDLASCRAVISTAGNQLVGEALWLGKPVLALPEPGNFEQEVNAFFLKRTGAGRACALQNLNHRVIRRFLHDEDMMLPHVTRWKRNGTPAALAVVQRYLNGAPPQVDDTNSPTNWATYAAHLLAGENLWS